MKWFKHMANMRNHPVVKAARYKWGNDPYTLWCLLLELCAESCGNDPDQLLEFDIKFLNKETMISWAKIKQFLNFFSENSLIFWRDFGEIPSKKIEIKILKLAHIKDNHTKNLQVTCKSLAPKKKEERDKKEEEPPVSPKGAKAKRAARLDENWEPNEALLTWALENHPTVDTRQQTFEFKNHFIANGKAYLDWGRTWQNWISRSKKFERPAYTGASKPTQATAVDARAIIPGLDRQLRSGKL